MRARTVLDKNVPDWQWKAMKLPVPEREFRFSKTRRWRFDHAFVAHQVAVEIEGGVYSKGRHVRGAGYEKDAEKYNAAAELGWIVLRYLPGKVDFEQIRRVLV